MSTFLTLVLHFCAPVWTFFSEILSITHKGHVAFAVVILIVGVREVVEKDFGSPYATNCQRLLNVVKVGCRAEISIAALGVDEELEVPVLDHGWYGVDKVHIVVVLHCVVTVQNVVV